MPQRVLRSAAVDHAEKTRPLAQALALEGGDLGTKRTAQPFFAQFIGVGGKVRHRSVLYYIFKTVFPLQVRYLQNLAGALHEIGVGRESNDGATTEER